MDDDVVHYLDKSLAHETLLELPSSMSDFKTECVDGRLRPEVAEVLQEIAAGQQDSGDGAQGSTGGPPEDAMVEMSTIMEGFRYLKNDNTLYPVLKKMQPCADFPIIPVGMLAIWRE